MFKSLTFAGAALITALILPLGASAKDHSPQKVASIAHAIHDSLAIIHEIKGGYRRDGRNQRYDNDRWDSRRDGGDYRHSPDYRDNRNRRWSKNDRGYSYHDRHKSKSRQRRELAHALTDYISYSINRGYRGYDRNGYGRHQRYNVHVNPSSINFGKHVNYGGNYRHNSSYGRQQDQCRKFKAKVTIDGHREKAKGVACQGRRGTWEIVDLRY